MNQSIQIQDGFETTDNDEIIITALHMGNFIRCVIHSFEGNDAETFYEQYQFDIEEALFELIEQERFEANGDIRLNANDV